MNYSHSMVMDGAKYQVKYFYTSKNSYFYKNGLPIAYGMCHPYVRAFFQGMINKWAAEPELSFAARLAEAF